MTVEGLEDLDLSQILVRREITRHVDGTDACWIWHDDVQRFAGGLRLCGAASRSVRASVVLTRVSIDARCQLQQFSSSTLHARVPESTPIQIERRSGGHNGG